VSGDAVCAAGWVGAIPWSGPVCSLGPFVSHGKDTIKQGIRPCGGDLGRGVAAPVAGFSYA